MAVTIDWSKAVGVEHTLTDGGYAGDMFKLVKAYVAETLDAQLITQEQAGATIVASIGTVLQEAVKVGLGMDLANQQLSETEANGAITRSVKSKDLTVKQAQADLLARQKKSLDDGLLKDLFKEASGGYAMVYDSVPSATVPDIWKNLDTLATTIQNRVPAV